MSVFKRIWAAVRRPSTSTAAGTLVLAGAVVAVIVGVGATKVMAYTNTTEFCTSCHTMQWPYEEAKETVHFANRSGVGPGCADCHVPKEFFPLVRAKIMAAKDVYHQILGTIDTVEQFEEHRLAMATRVWDQMKSTDSRECRNCHEWGRMAAEKQKLRAQTQHAEAQEKGETCIECHQGIAHKKPNIPQAEGPVDFGEF